MTTAEFLRLLEGTRDRFQWRLVPDDGAYAERRRRPRLHIRAMLTTNPDQHLEPAHAVCFATTGAIPNPNAAWDELTATLHMEPQDLADVVAASHDRTWKGDAGKRKPDVTLVLLRESPLRAVGLDEAGDAAEDEPNG